MLGNKTQSLWLLVILKERQIPHEHRHLSGMKFHNKEKEISDWTKKIFKKLSWKKHQGIALKIDE